VPKSTSEVDGLREETAETQDSCWLKFNDFLFPRWFRKPVGAPLFERLVPFDDECLALGDLRQLAIRCWTTVLPGQALGMPQISGRRLHDHFGLYLERQHVIQLPAYTGREVLLHELAHAIRLTHYPGERPLCSHDQVFARICLDLWIGGGLLADGDGPLLYALAFGVGITPRQEVEELLPGLARWRTRPHIPAPPTPVAVERWLIEEIIGEEFTDEDDFQTWCEGAADTYRWYDDDGEGRAPTVELVT
jgi:hypothetical protein